ncbi:MAG: hypothetical protein ACETWM_15335 [Candidatus Lokiarchaeia archaeon]
MYVEATEPATSAYCLLPTHQLPCLRWSRRHQSSSSHTYHGYPHTFSPPIFGLLSECRSPRQCQTGLALQRRACQAQKRSRLAKHPDVLVAHLA